jgi:hypothetical protein
MTTQTLKDISHKEVQNVMTMKNVPVSVGCMFEILQWCQQRTLEWVAETEDAQRRALAHTDSKEEMEIKE